MKENIKNFWTKNNGKIKGGLALVGSLATISFLLLIGYNRRKVVEDYGLQDILYVAEE